MDMNVLNDPYLLALRKDLVQVQRLMEKGIFTEPDTGCKYFTGYSYQTLYDWDQYFESLVQIYMGWPSEYIKNGVLIFLEHQQPSGLISRSVPSNELHDPEHVKPFLAQIALLVHKAYGEIDWILDERQFSRLERYIAYWLDDMDGNKNGLSEWMSAPHTGMDNQHERAGFWQDHFCEGVDLNGYLVRELRAFAQLASLAGKTSMAAEYRRKADELAERIRALLWDDTDGFFYDRNARAGEPLTSRRAGWAAAMNAASEERIRVKSAASFTALWAGVATPAQARRMVFEHLFNAREFWTPYPVATLARSERWYSRDRYPADLGCNWRATVWMSTNYMIYRGLRSYGCEQLASLVAHYTHSLVKRAGNYEWYDAETGEGCGLSPFWGWSLLAYFMPYEEQAKDYVGAL
jgi:putative isomerase